MLSDQWLNILIVGIYFAFLIVIGWIFRTFSSNTSDYFKGGGKMLWWMVGSTAFMTQFSAWSFTGAAGKAFSDGLSVMMIFLGNALGYFFNYLFFAAKSRQMRVVTPIEGIRLRFGKANEQVFTWASVPSSIFQAGIWLNGLAIFVSAVFDIPMSTTIVITGLIVVLMSACGGAWAVVASDFLQMLVIMAVSVVASLVAVFKSGGIGPILDKGLPENPLSGPGYSYMWLFAAWTVASFCKQFLSTNNMIDSYRYMCAKDTKNARKGALLACGLMLIGPFIWFLPDWFVAANYPDTSTWGLSALGSSIKDATYYIFVRNDMPAGTVGLMVAAMFAATMSSMDSALNRNAGIFVRNFYKPILRPQASDQEMLRVGQISTFGFGAVIIAVGVFLNSLENTSLFNMMMMVSSLISLPILIPSLLGFFVRKTPDWAAWATILVGAGVSSFVAFIVTPEMIQTVLGLPAPLTDREFSDMQSLTLGLVLHLCITLPFFLSTRLFYKGCPADRQQEVDLFFANISTEVHAEDSGTSTLDQRQRSLLGKLAAALGGCVCLLVFIPNGFAGRMVFVGIGGIILLAGIGLLFSAGELRVSKSTQNSASRK